MGSDRLAVMRQLRGRFQAYPPDATPLGLRFYRILGALRYGLGCFPFDYGPSRPQSVYN